MNAQSCTRQLNAHGTPTCIVTGRGREEEEFGIMLLAAPQLQALGSGQVCPGLLLRPSPKPGCISSKVPDSPHVVSPDIQSAT